MTSPSRANIRHHISSKGRGSLVALLVLTSELGERKRDYIYTYAMWWCWQWYSPLPLHRRDRHRSEFSWRLSKFTQDKSSLKVAMTQDPNCICVFGLVVLLVLTIHVEWTNCYYNGWGLLGERMVLIGEKEEREKEGESSREHREGTIHLEERGGRERGWVKEKERRRKFICVVMVELKPSHANKKT